MSKTLAKKGGKKPFKREPKEFEEEVIQIDRVTRVVKGGRRLRFRATVAIGDKNGRVGIGTGKSTEVAGAIQKGVAQAKKDLIKVNLINGTVPHQVKVKYKSAKVLILPAAPGTGIIAGGAVRKVLELAGVHNVLSKSLGSTNRLNCTRAAYKALAALRKNPFIKEVKKKKEETPVEEKIEKKAEKKAAPKKPTAKKPAAKKAEKKPAEKKDSAKQ